MTIVFESGNPHNVSDLIHYILSLKDVFLECVYDETISSTLLYCSSYRQYCLNKGCFNYKDIKRNTTRRHLERILEKWTTLV